MRNEETIKTIAFYLPQFHTIPENDKAYGKGFTEWTNTKKAKPLFEGHYQPRIPLNENYYCLLDDGIMQKQAELAKKYGVYGFCYYHYWFKNGKKLLEKPIELMLNNPSIDIPFCLCWANENWTRRWDGGDNNIIVEQDYGDLNDLKKHVDYLCVFFKDQRYIRIDDQPILLIYKPELIPNLKSVVEFIKKRVVENGFSGIKLVSQYPKFFMENVHLELFDYYVQFQPRFIQEDILNSSRSKIERNLKRVMISLGLRNFGKKVRKVVRRKAHTQVKKLEHRSYDDDWKYIIDYNVTDQRVIAGAFVDWDNTPRNKNGLVYDGASPEKFEKYMSQLVKKVKTDYTRKFIFINAWNEWAEGAYLEPDEKNKFGYLESLARSIHLE